MATRQMKLGLFIRPGGHHIACWRHPRAQADAGVNFAHFVEMAQLAERGLFDMLFSADNHTVWTVSESAIERVHYSNWMEPYTLLAALSGHTKNIGLVCTASTSFEQPYGVARKFAIIVLPAPERRGGGARGDENRGRKLTVFGGLTGACGATDGYLWVFGLCIKYLILSRVMCKVVRNWSFLSIFKV